MVIKEWCTLSSSKDFDETLKDSTRPVTISREIIHLYPQIKLAQLKTTLVQRLKKTEKFDEYDTIIQDQLQQGIIEEAEMPATAKEFYLPHRPVVRETAETTKTRIVYDAPAKSHDSEPSLNDCLEIGPPLQNKLWQVLVRGRFYPIALAGDLRQAFLQVRIRPEDRDVLRFHWLSRKDPQLVCALRFTRVLFGLAPSPFLLGGVIQHHLNSCRDKQPERVEDIEHELYVDDLSDCSTSDGEEENCN